MIRRIIYLVLIAAVLFAPVDRVNINLLHPIELVYVYKEKNQVMIKTDGADAGEGNSLQEAVANMVAMSSGIVYLDTVKYLLVDKELQASIGEMKTLVNGNARLCLIDGNLEIMDILLYIRTRKNLPRLEQWKQGEKLPILTCEKNFKKVENKA